MMIRPMTIAATLSVALAGSALANPNWTGFYAGLQGGYSDQNSVQYELNAPSGTYNNDWDLAISGAVAGAHLGYNHQMGDWVFGVEGDLEFADISGVVDTDPDFGYEDIDWLGSLRLRAGYTDGVLLIYATGGLAVGGVDMLATESIPVTDSISDDDTPWGYTVGGGIEFAFSPQWSGRIEYRWTDLDDTVLVGNIYGGDFIYTHENEFSTVRIGVSYHLN